MKTFSLKYKLLVITVLALLLWAVAADIPFTFKAGDVISAEQMNQNLAILNSAKQELIKGSCAAGSAIRVINKDGTVTCEVDDIGTPGASGVDAINGMTGAVTLQAGDNITIDDSTQGQIKISATSGGTNSNNHDHFGQTWKGSSPTSGLAVINSSFNGAGIYGQSPIVGIHGQSPFIAVRGEGESIGVQGSSTRSDGSGVMGSNETDGIGVYGVSKDGTAVYGYTLGSKYGVSGFSSSGRGVFGESHSGVGVYGYRATNDAIVGVTATGNTTHAAIAGSSDDGFAAYFEAGLGVGKGYATCTFKAGTTNWACSSDKNLKDNFEAVNPVQILEFVARIPVTTWTMKGSTIRQMGPTSQDFYAAFKLGDSDKSINNTDAQGVALAAIQGLYQLAQEQQAKIEALEAQLAKLSKH